MGPTPLVHTSDERKAQQSLETDIMFIAKQAFLVTLSHPMGLLSVDLMPTAPKSAATLKVHLFNHINSYRSHRYDVIEVRCDEEPGLLALRSDLNAIGIKLTTGVRNSKNTATPGVDGKINVVKERVRTTLLDLPTTCHRTC